MTTTEFQNLLRILPPQDTVVVVSKPGIKAFTVVQNLAEELGIERRCLYLSGMLPEDFRGLPYLKDGEEVFAKPNWIPSDPNSKGILYLDDIENCDCKVAELVFEICLYRKIFEEKLPNGWRVILKLDDMNYLDPSLLNCFVVFTLE